MPLMNPQASPASRQRSSCSFGSVITCVRVTDTRWRSTPSSGQMDGQRKGMYGVPRDKSRCSFSRVGDRGAKNSCNHPVHDYVSLLLAPKRGECTRDPNFTHPSVPALGPQRVVLLSGWSHLLSNSLFLALVCTIVQVFYLFV